jgi:hypothetical protein
MTETSRSGIDVLEAPSVEEFEKRYLEPGRPVLIKGVVDKWPAAGRWSPDYLVERVGRNEVPVSVMPSPGDYAGARRERMPLADYYRQLTRQEHAEAPLYLGEVALQKFFPELVPEVERPAYFRDEEPLNAVLYFGQKQFSQLHYHPQGSATLCLLYGSKRVWLFAPDQTPYLYKYPWYSANHNMSLTTSPAPDPARFPKFAQAKPYELVVKAGELLFIPIYWWHSIQNEETNIAVVFFWYKQTASRWLPPAGMRADYLLEVDRKLVKRAKRVFLGKKDSKDSAA